MACVVMGLVVHRGAPSLLVFVRAGAVWRYAVSIYYEGMIYIGGGASALRRIGDR